MGIGFKKIPKGDRPVSLRSIDRNMADQVEQNGECGGNKEPNPPAVCQRS